MGEDVAARPLNKHNMGASAPDAGLDSKSYAPIMLQAAR